MKSSEYKDGKYKDVESYNYLIKEYDNLQQELSKITTFYKTEDYCNGNIPIDHRGFETSDETRYQEIKELQEDIDLRLCEIHNNNKMKRHKNKSKSYNWIDVSEKNND